MLGVWFPDVVHPLHILWFVFDILSFTAKQHVTQGFVQVICVPMTSKANNFTVRRRSNYPLNTAAYYEGSMIVLLLFVQLVIRDCCGINSQSHWEGIRRRFHVPA